ncbi:MAG: helix-turn-helix transcriptional regulator [Clostridia bacterium]|nr:helix-turn-helix transcriptional regulator [Clostridia bacterium]MBQ8236392.1 helix-turn-helix transcriptional regulator [Clostridia bacterium]MBQ8398366.1 helix-turn-helix transcriptional regulator [Clostridia bacterium]
MGEKIKYHRKRCGYTQGQLANKLYVTSQAVSKWENGYTLPDVMTFAHLARLFGVSMEELINE